MTFLVLACIGSPFPAPTFAQGPEGSRGATVAGAALGLYTGAAVGGLASIIPCNQTRSGIGCVRAVTTIGAGIGLTAGLSLGREDADAVWDAYGRAGIGAGAGAVAVLALKPFVDRWSVADVAAGAVIGSSIAAGGRGAWVGLLSGAAVGTALWHLVPALEAPDAIGIALAGMAIGGFTSWIAEAVDSPDTPPGDPAILRFDVGVPW